MDGPASVVHRLTPGYQPAVLSNHFTKPFNRFGCEA